MNKKLSAIITQLKTIPELRYVNLNFGQLDAYFDQKPVVFPCAIIEVKEIDYQHISNFNDQQHATLSIRMASQQLGSLNNAQAETQLVNLVEQVHIALQSFAPNGNKGGKMLRKKLIRRSREDGISEWEYIYHVPNW